MKKVLVIGDGCTDMFQYGVCERLCPEAPVPIFKPTKVVTTGGMAINVADNIKALGIECDIVTNDMRPVKTRFVDEVSNQILLRMDVNDKIEDVDLNILHNIDFSKYEAVVISDYNKGFLTGQDIEYITEKHDLVFMDTKKKIGYWAEGVEFIKINEKEFKENWTAGIDIEYDGELVMTKGKDGAILNSSVEFPIENEHPVRDLSGAGDTFLAALVVEYLKNNNIDEAIRFANKCAAWVVTQKGVVVVDPTQI